MAVTATSLRTSLAAGSAGAIADANAEHQAVNDLTAMFNGWTTAQRQTHVTVGTTGDFATITAALAAYSSGGVDIELLAGAHTLSAALAPSGVTNVTIRGQGRGATTVTCTAGFVSATSSSDRWTIRDMSIVHAAGTNTDNGIEVDYPRRWDVADNIIQGFGGKSVRYRGGLHSWVRRNLISAEDSTNTNGGGGIYIELSSGAVVASTIVTQHNYISAGKDYGIYAESAKQSIFDGDIVEACTVGIRLQATSGELRQPYTESNTTAIQLHDCAVVVHGQLRDEPVVTWAGGAVPDRHVVRISGREINAGRAIIYGPGNLDATTAPSIRWGTGSPEGVITGVLGAAYLRTNGGAGTTLYIKESGTGNTGWTAVVGAPSYGTPTPAAAAGNGTSPPTPTLEAGSNDVAGGVIFGSGTSPTTGLQMTVTFSTAMSTAPKTVILFPANFATASRQVYGFAISTTGFDIAFGVVPAASQGGTTYKVRYLVYP